MCDINNTHFTKKLFAEVQCYAMHQPPTFGIVFVNIPDAAGKRAIEQDFTLKRKKSVI